MAFAAFGFGLLVGVVFAVLAAVRGNGEIFLQAICFGAGLGVLLFGFFALSLFGNAETVLVTIYNKGAIEPEGGTVALYESGVKTLQKGS